MDQPSPVLTAVVFVDVTIIVRRRGDTLILECVGKIGPLIPWESSRPR